MGLLPQEDIEQVKQDLIAYIRNVCDLDPWLKSHQPKVWFEGLIAEIVAHRLRKTSKK